MLSAIEPAASSHWGREAPSLSSSPVHNLGCTAEYCYTKPLLLAVFSFSVADDAPVYAIVATPVPAGQVASSLELPRKFYFGRTVFGRLYEPMAMAVA